MKLGYEFFWARGRIVYEGDRREMDVKSIGKAVARIPGVTGGGGMEREREGRISIMFTSFFNLPRCVKVMNNHLILGQYHQSRQPLTIYIILIWKCISTRDAT